jgi:peptidyl-prolyl cis-trans isomerase D
MITFFRKFFQSKIGIGVTLAFLGLIALAFASSDVANTGSFGGIAGGETVAEVGGTSIDTAELRAATEVAYNNARRENPDLTIQEFIAGGGLEGALDNLIQRAAITEYGEKYGIIASDRLIDSELAQIPAFAGLDGNFSRAAFDQALRQQGLTEKMVRDDLRQALVIRQLLAPAQIGSGFPEELAYRYTTLLRESRRGKIATIPSSAFAPETNPSDEQLAEFYGENRARFTIPERRVIRYARFGADSIGEVAAPTPAEIRARYEANADEYRASEERTITQLIAPTEAGANAILAKVRAGQTLAAAAQGTGLSPSEQTTERATYASASSAAVARAVFAADQGDVVGPVQSPLGWHIVDVDTVTRTEGRTLAQASEEIAAALTELKRREALNQFAEDVEDGFASGSTLADVAGELGVEVERTRPALASGVIYGTQERVPELLNPILTTVAAMEEDSDPILAEIVPGEEFLIFDVAQFDEAAPPPLTQIKDRVTAAWKLDRGAAAAKKAADEVLAAVRGGADLDAAIADIDAPLPPVDDIDLSRQALTAQQQRVPPPLALMFAMAEGTIKKLEAPTNAGWFVVLLDDIIPGEVERDDPAIAQARTELGRVAGQEFAEQLDRAIQKEVGVTRNDNAIRAVVEELTGQGR